MLCVSVIVLPWHGAGHDPTTCLALAEAMRLSAMDIPSGPDRIWLIAASRRMKNRAHCLGPLTKLCRPGFHPLISAADRRHHVPAPVTD